MKATITWNEGAMFTGQSSSGIPIQMESAAYQKADVNGLRPMEMILMGLAGCMAMDVLSILEKKRQHVTAYRVAVDAPRSSEYPMVFTGALITFILSGRKLDEKALLRSIELSVTKYCAGYAMLEKAFPMRVDYEIFEEDGLGNRQLTHQGTWQAAEQD